MGGDSQPPAGVVVAVTDHAVERFRQRVASRRGELDARPEIAARVAEAWAQRRVSDRPPAGAQGAAAPARPARAVYVQDVHDRDLVFVCRHDPARGELVVITLWETERLRPARVPRRFTDALDLRGRGG